MKKPIVFIIVATLIFSAVSCRRPLFDRFGFLEVENQTPFPLQITSKQISSYLDMDTGEKVDARFGRLFDLEPGQKKRIQVRIGPYEVRAIVPYRFEKVYTVNVYDREVGVVVIYE